MRTVRYGALPDQEADLQLPADTPAARHPIVVLIHGGFWRAAYDRSLMQPLALDLAQRGWASWNLEYRRVGTGGGVPETLDDITAAIAHVPRLDAAIDTDRLAVVGHSAGGHLALCTAGLPNVGAIVSLAGVCDLRAGYAEGIGDQAVAGFLGGSPAQRADAYDLADPLTRLPHQVPTLLVHGDTDDRVPISQSRTYAAAGGGTLLELPGVGHRAVIDPSSDAWAVAADWLTVTLR